MMTKDIPSPVDDTIEAWSARVDVACDAHGITTGEGVVYDDATGEVSDAMQWEVDNEAIEM